MGPEEKKEVDPEKRGLFGHYGCGPQPDMFTDIRMITGVYIKKGSTQNPQV